MFSHISVIFLRHCVTFRRNSEFLKWKSEISSKKQIFVEKSTNRFQLNTNKLMSASTISRLRDRSRETSFLSDENKWKTFDFLFGSLSNDELPRVLFLIELSSSIRIVEHGRIFYRESQLDDRSNDIWWWLFRGRSTSCRDNNVERKDNRGCSSEKEISAPNERRRFDFFRLNRSLSISARDRPISFGNRDRAENQNRSTNFFFGRKQKPTREKHFSSANLNLKKNERSDVVESTENWKQQNKRRKTMRKFSFSRDERIILRL